MVVKSFHIVLAALWLAVGGATPTPSTTCPSSGAGGNIFGIPASSKRGLSAPQTSPPNPLHIRGGELHQPETVEEMDALVLYAATHGKLLVIDFTASWCGPCKMIAPLFKEMSETIADVVFVKVDVDENPGTAAKYSVSAMPTFVFIKQGEVADRLMGANVQRLQEMIEENM